MYHSTLGLRVTKKKKVWHIVWVGGEERLVPLSEDSAHVGAIGLVDQSTGGGGVSSVSRRRAAPWLGSGG